MHRNFDCASYSFLLPQRSNPTSMSFKPEPAIWSHGTGQRIACSGQQSINNSEDGQNQRCSYSATLSFQGVGVRTDGRTDSHVKTKIFQIDELPYYRRYGAPLASRGSDIRRESRLRGAHTRVNALADSKPKGHQSRGIHFVPHMARVPFRRKCYRSLG